MPRKKTPEPPAEYGYIVRASPVRAGTTDGTVYLCDDNKRFGFAGAVGLGNLQAARFHSRRDPRDAAGNTPFQQAVSYAMWQRGEVRFAKRQAGIIFDLGPCGWE